MLKIRRSQDHLIFNMGISVLIRWYLYILRALSNLFPDSIQRCCLTSIGSPIVEIRLSWDHLISTMELPVVIRWHFYIASAPTLFHTMPSVYSSDHFNNYMYFCIFSAVRTVVSFVFCNGQCQPYGWISSYTILPAQWALLLTMVWLNWLISVCFQCRQIEAKFAPLEIFSASDTYDCAHLFLTKNTTDYSVIRSISFHSLQWNDTD